MNKGVLAGVIAAIAAVVAALTVILARNARVVLNQVEYQQE